MSKQNDALLATLPIVKEIKEDHDAHRASGLMESIILDIKEAGLSSRAVMAATFTAFVGASIHAGFDPVDAFAELHAYTALQPNSPTFQH